MPADAQGCNRDRCSPPYLAWSPAHQGNTLASLLRERTERVSNYTCVWLSNPSKELNVQAT